MGFIIIMMMMVMVMMMIFAYNDVREIYLSCGLSSVRSRYIVKLKLIVCQISKMKTSTRSES